MDEDLDESYQIKVANACRDIISEVGLPRSIDGIPGMLLRVDCSAGSSLPFQQQEEVYSIAETNMKDIYNNFGWGWQPVEKRNEFFHPLSRVYILVDQSSSQIIGFGIFRFEYDDEEEPEFIVLYIYELQIREPFQRMGYGAKVGDLCYIGEISSNRLSVADT